MYISLYLGGRPSDAAEAAQLYELRGGVRLALEPGSKAWGSLALNLLGLRYVSICGCPSAER